MEKRIIELAQKAIRIKSTADNKKNLVKIMDLFVGRFSDTSIFEVKRFLHEGKPSAIIKPKSKEPKIWFNAHLDIVPGEDHLFSPRIINDRLIGRGALDMKTAASCMTELTRKLIQEGNNIGLMLVTDEEIGGHKGTKFLMDQKVVNPEFVIVGEATDLEIGIESKGVLSLEIISKGKSAHGSRPWLGKNAFEEMIKPIQVLLTDFPIPKKEVWKTTINIGVIHAGDAVNQVPDRCILKLDIRYVPQDEPHHILKLIKKIFSKQEVVVKMLEAPIFSKKTNPYIRLFAKSIKTVLNMKPIFRRGHGSADIRFFTEKGIPAIAFGLRGKGLHSNHEWVSLKEINKYVKILESFVIIANNNL